MKKSNKKTILAEIKENSTACISNRKHANKIVDVIGYLQDEDSSVVQAAVRAVNKVFSHFIDVGELQTSDTDASKESQYKEWLQQRFADAVDSLVDLIPGRNEAVQEITMATLMKLVVKTAKLPNCSNMPSAASLYKKVLQTLLTGSGRPLKLLVMLQEYLEYDDVRYLTLNKILAILNTCTDQPGNHEEVLNNIFSVLEHIQLPVERGAGDGPGMPNFLIYSPEDAQKICSEKGHKKLFTSTWVNFLRFKLPTSLYRRTLVILHDKVMPYMTDPKLLTDFLTDSYNIGGAISLLALNGLFVLIHKHNLNYPNFYTKLYALFEPGIFHAKYRARFFYLCDLFLSSTHLPAYLVAAFAKRLSRISLTAPPSGLLIAIPFVYNLINRHPVCKQMINRPDDEEDYTNDPYVEDEPDPAQCHALKSCLWEIKTLQSHYNPEVAKVALKIDTALPDLETDLSKLLDTTTDDMFERCGKKIKTAAVTFEPPSSLLGGRDDRLHLCWTI